MTDYVESLKAAALRNGRECADAAIATTPPPWSDEEYTRILDTLAISLVESFPGGPAMFLPFAKTVTAYARDGFDGRLRELGITPGSTGFGHEGA